MKHQVVASIGFVVTAPVTIPRNGVIFERLVPNTRVNLVAAFLHANLAAP
jgi:hypothetical protein